MTELRTHLNTRLAEFTSTIFAEMSALATSTGSVNLGQGFPDTDGPSEIAEAAVKAIRDGHNQYPPGNGIPSLRVAIAEHQGRFYARGVDPDREVLVTTGATEAIAALIISLCEYGDEVVLFEPYYDSYAAAVAIAGARRKVVRLNPPDWTFDPERLRSLISDRTKLIILNTPHNPTGKVFSRSELESIASIAIEHRLVVVCDEVYEHLVFDSEHLSISTLPDMAERTVVVSSAAKTFSFTGWKVGWMTGPTDLIAAARASKQFLTYVSGAPFQVAIAFALNQTERFIPLVREPLRKQRDLLHDALSDIGLSPFPSAGSYFLVTDVAQLQAKDSYSFCIDLAHTAGVVAVPTSVFYDSPPTAPQHVRWTFSKSIKLLELAAERLQRRYGNHGAG